MSVLVVGSEDIIKNLDKYKEQLARLTDPRKTTEAEARAIIKTAKPIYWITSGMHSPETGGPEMLMELAYRLVVEETPFVQNIRSNVITIITPVVETDGRDKVVDAYNYSKAHPGVSRNNLMMYWGKYVQHDNNRDGMGQFLQLTRNIEKFGKRVAPRRFCTISTRRRRCCTRRRAPARTTTSSTRSPSTNGGRSPKTTCSR